MNIPVTGGAGFIGSHIAVIADKLRINCGYDTMTQYQISVIPMNGLYADVTTNLCKSVKSVSLNFLDTDLHGFTQILPKVFVENITGKWGNAMEHGDVRDSMGIFVRMGEGKRDLKYVLLRKDAHKLREKLRKNNYEDDMGDD